MQAPDESHQESGGGYVGIHYAVKQYLDIRKQLIATEGQIDDIWVHPGYEDSLLFALTEIGEALDASLRMDPRYSRNRDRTMSVKDEMADAVIMLVRAATAIFERDEIPSLLSEAIETSLNQRLAMAARFTAIACSALTRVSTHSMYFYLALAISELLSPDVDMTEIVRTRLERIRKRVEGIRAESERQA